MPQIHPDAVYPINAVSKLTGVSCHALRVWERRYGFPVPQRSASGHRRYGVEQVQLIKRISEMARSGRSIGELIAGMQAGRLKIEVEPQPGIQASNGDACPLDEFMTQLLQGELNAAVEYYEKLESGMPADELVSNVIAPALTETGERWFRKRCTVYQEHFISGFLRRKLSGLVDDARRANEHPSATVLLGSVQGDRHEGGVLIANLMLERAGIRVINLGADLPVSEFTRAAEALKPDAVALSFVLSRNINKRFQELATLRGVPVFVGGRSILNYQGLARRYGLIPLTGSVTAAVRELGEELAARRRQGETKVS